jgi:hypothetical protein
MSGHYGGVGPSKTKEETAYNSRLRGMDVTALTTLRIFAPTDWKSRMMVINLD